MDHDSDIQYTFNDQLFLETLLMEIRVKTTSFASYFIKKIIEEISQMKEEYEMRSDDNGGIGES